MKTTVHFSASLMSNAKWRKFFSIVAEDPEHVFAADWKLIDELKHLRDHLPASEDIWHQAVDGCLNGPVSYDKIEWIELPSRIPFRRYENAPMSYHVQDLQALQRRLTDAGQFPTQVNEARLRICGYRLKAAEPGTEGNSG